MTRMVELLPCVEVGPEEGATAAIVWLHGLGASGHDFEDIVPLLRLPRVRFVFPHAPRRGVTINGGLIMPAWYDILRFSDAAGSERADQVRESAEMVEALLARERDRGVPSEHTVLAGFSQGGALALYAGVRHAHALAGIMVLSGYEVLPADRPEPGGANAATPMLFAHGTHDPVVPAQRGRLAQRAYEAGRESAWHEYPMGHEVCLEEIADIREWLHARLGPEAAAP
jgi:phospholipase/carboxylesterase